MIKYSVNSGGDPIAILRMDVIEPPLDLRKDLVLLVPEYVFDGIIPDESAGLDVPVPDDVVRGSCHEAKTLVGRAHGALGLSLVGHVNHNRDGGYDLAISIVHGSGAHADVAI